MIVRESDLRRPLQQEGRKVAQTGSDRSLALQGVAFQSKNVERKRVMSPDKSKEDPILSPSIGFKKLTLALKLRF